MTGPRDAADAHCFDLVRSADKDRFLASLFMPDDVRPYVLAIYAFNIEIARIRETVSDAAVGELRLQWWRDAIEAIYAGEVPPHPVAQTLARAIGTAMLPKLAFANMIEARSFDLYDDPMPDTNSLEGYLGETSSMLIQLCATVLAGREAETASEAAGLAGVAYGLTGLLRALPIHRSRGQCFIPMDVLARHDVTPAHLIAGRDTDRLTKPLNDMRKLAMQRLQEARAMASGVPQKASPAFLAVCLVDGYLAQLEKLGAGALTSVAEVSQLKRQYQLLMHARTGKF